MIERQLSVTVIFKVFKNALRGSISKETPKGADLSLVQIPTVLIIFIFNFRVIHNDVGVDSQVAKEPQTPSENE